MIYTFNYHFLLPESPLRADEQPLQTAFSQLVCSLQNLMLGDFVPMSVKKLNKLVFHCTL